MISCSVSRFFSKTLNTKQNNKSNNVLTTNSFPLKQTSKYSTVNPKEISHFSNFSKDWWDPEGSMKALHNINPTRMKFVRNKIIDHFGLNPQKTTPLEEIRILDAGCGCGLVSEPLARMGGIVLGIDPSPTNILVAQTHSSLDPSLSNLSYLQATTSDLLEKKEEFDVVVSLEVIEHVDNQPFFVQSCTQLLKNGGLLILSTINRNYKSYLTAILAAEYILQWVPKGTHSWDKFVTPDELKKWILSNDQMNLKHEAGLTYTPLCDKWDITDDSSINYFIVATKNKQK